MPFAHNIGDAVRIKSSGIKCHVRARAEYEHGENNYLVRYHYLDAQLFMWWDESQLERVEAA